MATATLVQLRWPLLLFPCASAFFWTSYVLLMPRLGPIIAPIAYASFNQFNERCWRQNILSGVHTCLSVLLLTTALATEADPFSRRLYRLDGIWLDADIAFSLGYFSFALPMSYHMSFTLKAGFPYGSPLMVLHHTLTFVAQSTFLLTGYGYFYMGTTGLLFELTNVFFIPHVLMEQLRSTQTLLRTLNGLMLVITYTCCRALACTILAVLMTLDLSRLDPPNAGGWLAYILLLCCLYGLLGMSWYWYVGSILPSLHAELQERFGEHYLHSLVPAYVRQLAWRWCTQAGRDQREQDEEKRRVVAELRKDMQMADAEML